MIGKRHTWLALIVIFALVAASCGDSDEPENTAPIKIGVLNPTTSFLATLGLDANAAIEYYFNTEVGGEIAGRPIELIFEDTAADPVLALTKAQKLIERDNVDIILGPLDTPEGFAVRDYIQGQGVPWVLHVGAGWPPHDLDLRGPYSFAVAPTNPQTHFAMAEYAYDELGYRSMIITALDYAPGQEIAQGFKEAFEAKGGTIVDTVLIPLGAADTAPYITQILNQADQADAVNAALWAPAAIGFVNEGREFGLFDAIDVIGFHTLTPDLLDLEEQGANALGIKTYYWYMLYNDYAENQKWVKAYTAATGGSPNVWGAFGYLGAKAIGEAIADAGGDVSPDSFADAMLDVSFDSPAGPFKMDEFGQGIHTVWIGEVEDVDGSIRNIVFDSIEDVDQFYGGFVKPPSE
jgi:branched-chain amino acid transport system substrate-binding protein